MTRFEKFRVFIGEKRGSKIASANRNGEGRGGSGYRAGNGG